MFYAFRAIDPMMKNRNRHKSLGFTLLELMAVLAVSLVLMAAGTTYVVRYLDNVANDAAADHIKVIAKGASEYARANEQQILATLDGAPVATVSVETLKGEGYINPGVATTNNFGQAYAIRFVRKGPTSFDGLLVTQGGEPISGLNMRKIAGALGGAGGHISEDGTSLRGTVWQRDLADFGLAAADQPELAYALFVDDAIETAAPFSDQYLSRRAVDGLPELNTMLTDMDMGGNDLSNVAELSSFNVTTDGLTANEIDAEHISVQDIEGRSVSLTGGLEALGTIQAKSLLTEHSTNLTASDHLDSLPGTGFYSGISPAGMPGPSGRYYIQNIQRGTGGDYTLQLAWREAATEESYWRIQSAGGWGPWRVNLHSGLVDPDNIVTRTGDQSIAGEKTFTDRAYFNVTGGLGPVVTRPDATINSTIEYRVQGSVARAGLARQGIWGIGNALDLSIASNRWLSVSSALTEVPGDFVAGRVLVGTNEAWHRGNFNPDLKLDAVAYNAPDVLAKLKTVDGAGSGLDADLLDGQSGAFYRNATNLNAGTIPNARLPGRLNVNATTLVDWNDGIETGWWQGLDAANSPRTGWIIGEVVAHNSSYVTQTVHAFTLDSGADTWSYRRDRNGGTWTPWSRLRITAEEQEKLWVNQAGDAMSGQLSIEGTNRPLVFKSGAIGHSFMEWYVNPDAQNTRSGYLGFGSGSSSTMTMANQKPDGGINLATTGTGQVMANGHAVWHAGNFNPDTKANVSDVVTLAGTQTITGRKSFNLSPIFNVTSGDVPQVKRTNHTANASIEFSSTAGSIYAGLGAPSTFAVGPVADLQGSPWFTVNAAGAKINGQDVWHRGNLDPASFIQDKGSLGGGVNLNNIRDTGIYHQPANANAGSGVNYPEAVAGMLTVYSSSVMTYQTYQRYNAPERWHRSFYNGAWSGWALEWNSHTFNPDTKANDSDVVKLSGAQYVTGTKTFSHQIMANGGIHGPLHHSSGYLTVGAYGGTHGTGDGRLWYSSALNQYSFQSSGNALSTIRAGAINVSGDVDLGGNINTTGTNEGFGNFKSLFAIVRLGK